MTNRWYIGFAATLLAGVLAYAWWSGSGPSEDGVRSARLRATWTIDLETGEQGTPQADLHWGMQGPELPYLATRGKALIARAGAKRWEELDAAALAQLSYAPGQISAWGPDAPVKKGAVFGVQTQEGKLAKVRVADIRRNYALDLEWAVLGSVRPVAAKGETAVKPGPTLAWHALREEALAAYREQRNDDAFEGCRKAVAAAAQAGEAQHALALTTCGGLFGLHRQYPDQMEDWLKAAKAIAMKLDQAAIVAALGSRETLLKERALRALGVFYRDRNRTGEAVENFALAVDAVRALPPPETAEQRLVLRSDLYELGVALAKLGYRGTALRALGEAREYYLKSEPSHPTLKAIEAQMRRLEGGK